MSVGVCEHVFGWVFFVFFLSKNEDVLYQLFFPYAYLSRSITVDSYHYLKELAGV